MIDNIVEAYIKNADDLTTDVGGVTVTADETAGITALTAAASVAAGMGAQVTIMDIDLDRLRHLSEVMPPNVTTLASNPYNIESRVKSADLVIGAVLLVGAKAPKLVTR